MSSSSSSIPFYLPSNNLFQQAVPTQDVTSPISLPSMVVMMMMMMMITLKYTVQWQGLLHFESSFRPFFPIFFCPSKLPSVLLLICQYSSFSYRKLLPVMRLSSSISSYFLTFSCISSRNSNLTTLRYFMKS